MPRSSVRAVGALGALLAGLALVAAPAATAYAGTGTEAPADTGIVEIPYGEPLDLRAPAGWRIDCAAVGALDEADLACTEESVTLTAPFDTGFGEQVLVVAQRSGAAQADVRYRVRLAPPAPPEVAASAIPVPLPAHRQSLVPLSLLRITCGLCADARIEIVDVVPDTARIGVGPTHLAVRPSAPGPIDLTVRVTDDAGQSVDADLRLFATTPLADAPVAFHVAGPDPAALSALVADRGTVACLAVDPALTCDAEGAVAAAGEIDRPVQATLRVVDAAGRQALGSLTIAPDASPAPVAPAWGRAADLGIAVPLPPEDETDVPSLLAPLSRILQEVPAS